MALAVNEADFADPDALREATGYRWLPAIDGAAPQVLSIVLTSDGSEDHVIRNGGMEVERRVELYEGDTLLRLSRRTGRDFRPLTPEQHLNSPWWMNDGRFDLLHSRASSAGVDIIEMARRQLAIPEDFSTLDVLVKARPHPGLLVAAHAGPGRTAESGGERRIIPRDYAPKYAAVHYLDQLYIPGLGQRPWSAAGSAGNALRWLQFEGLFDPRTLARIG